MRVRTGSSLIGSSATPRPRARPIASVTSLSRRPAGERRGPHARQLARRAERRRRAVGAGGVVGGAPDSPRSGSPVTRRAPGSSRRASSGSGRGLQSALPPRYAKRPAPPRPRRASGNATSGTGKKPKRTQTRSSPCGRANTVSIPEAVAVSTAALTSWMATSRGSVSISAAPGSRAPPGGPSRDSTTTGPWSRAAAPARSVTTAPARPRPSAHAPRAQPGAGWGGHAAAANSNSPRAASRSSSGRYSTPRQTRGSVRAASGAAPGSDGFGAVDATGRRGLLLAKHRVLQGFRDPELQHALGRDLQGLAGLRVAPHAGLAVGEDELAEAGEDEAVLGLLGREANEVVHHFPDLFLGK